MMRDYANMESLFNVALEVEWVLVELGEILFELLKEKHEENMNVGKTTMEKHVQLLNESFFNLLKRYTKMRIKPKSTLGVSSSFNGCQNFRVKDHLATNCPKYAKPNVLNVGSYIRQRIVD